MCMLHDTPAKFSEKDFLGICNLDADLPNEFVTIVLKLLETHRSIHISCDHFQESLPALRQYKWVRVTSLLRPFVAHLEDVYSLERMSGAGAWYRLAKSD